MKQQITQKRLKKEFRYDPDTGEFERINNTRGRYPGITGGVHNAGYISISIGSKMYLAHRLAWLYVHGYFPENEIDHIDRDKKNNRISNLREVSRQCNTRNKPNQKNNTSGVKGVCWYKKYKKWQVRIKVDGKTHFIGYYKEKLEAVCHRLAVEQQLNWSGCDSNSPAYKYVSQKIKRGN